MPLKVEQAWSNSINSIKIWISIATTYCSIHLKRLPDLKWFLWQNNTIPENFKKKVKWLWARPNTICRTFFACSDVEEFSTHRHKRDILKLRFPSKISLRLDWSSYSLCCLSWVRNEKKKLSTFMVGLKAVFICHTKKSEC